ncbi:MAG: DUF2125 domain-containing protein [Fuscovulum sp.]|nr:DUF2125 domain-containing protein [Fuscovulum sp.]
MRLVKWLAVILGLAVVGGWFGVAFLIEKGAAAMLEDLRARGTTLESSAPEVGGFPLEWRLGLTGLRLADPVSGAGWQGPSLALRAATWAPWHLTADLPDAQVISTPGLVLTLDSRALVATLGSAPDPALPLREATLRGDSLRVQSDAGWVLALGGFDITLAADDTRPPGAYSLTFDLAPLTPDPALAEALAQVALPDLPAPDFPASLDRLEGRLALRFAGPVGLIDETAPPLEAIEIAAADAAWGQLALHAEGLLEADAQGFAAGRVMLRLTNWDRLPALLVALGAIKPEIAPTIAGGLRAMAAQSPDPAVLALPLDMRDGRMTLGPFPLGEAPRLRPPES